jgi:hypothetical protein
MASSDHKTEDVVANDLATRNAFAPRRLAERLPRIAT